MKLKVDYFSKWLLLLLVMGLSNAMIAQRTITGTVTDASDGEPLIGANILVVGTSSGTVTDFDGTYSLDVPEGSTQLEFSYTGYSSQTITLGASNVVDLALSAGAVLDEIVVTGYGTQKAKEVTSSISSVKAEDFNAGNVNNPAQLLQGKVAGLVIARPGGDPNEGFQVRLRGLATLGANTQPLLVIDGVIGASLDNVDPNDIESIDVLKDGSAAAIYGTRASSGVILVTTRKGQSGVSSVNYNGYVASESIARSYEVLSPQEFAALPGSRNNGFSTDWQDQVTRNAISHAHNLSMSGGTSQTSYRASVNFRKIEGVQIGTGFTSLNGRLNLNQKALNDRLNINFNVAMSTRDSDFGYKRALQMGILYDPTAPVRVNDPAFERWGGYFEEDLFDYDNPVSIIEQTTNEGKLKDILGNIKLDYEIIEGLKAGVSYAQQRESDLFAEYAAKTARFNGFNRNGLAQRRTEDRQTDLFEATGNYDRDFGSTNMKILVGYSWQEFTTEGHGAQGGDFITDAFSYNNLGASLDFDNGLGNVYSYKNRHRLIAFFGRVNFNIDDTYFVTASIRREGSSRFGENNKWGNFPAASAGVNLTKALNLGGIDNLKLRVGYGVTGAIPGESYLSIQRFGPGQAFFFNGEFVPSYGPVSNPNPDLKWERKAEIDVGLDFAFLDFKLTGSIDYYQRTTNDLLWNASVPVPPNLFDRTWLNLGELKNNGLELALSYNAVSTQKMSWTTSVTFSTFKTVLESLSSDQFEFGDVLDIGNVGSPGLNGIRTMRLIEGQEIGRFFAPVYDGLNDDGTWRFKDISGDGTYCDCPDDFDFVGSGLPTAEIGWNNSFTFGNFDLNFFIRGAFGHNNLNLYRVFYEPIVGNTTWNRVKTDFFNPDLTSEAKFSSFQVENASFVKLDNASLGYSFNLPDGGAFTKIRLYLAGQNLFWITDYQGADPEVRFADSAEDNNPLLPGHDRRETYFATRTITFGLNLGF